MTYDFDPLDYTPLPSDPTVEAWNRPDVEAAREAFLEDSLYLAVMVDGEPDILDPSETLDFDDALIRLVRAYNETKRDDGIGEARKLCVVKGLEAKVVIATGEALARDEETKGGVR